MNKLLLCLFLISFCFALSAQRKSNVVIIPTSESFFGYCIDNTFKVIARQSTPITIDKIRARIVTGYKLLDDTTIVDIFDPLPIEEYQYRKGEFIIKGINKLGRITFEIDLETGTEEVFQELIPLPVKFYIKNYRLGREEWQKKDKKLEIYDLKEVEGIYGKVDYNGLNAGVTVLHFQITAIIDNVLQPEILNKGGRFTDKTLALIQKLKADDMIIIKNLTYKNCFSKKSLAPILIELK